MPKLLRNTKNAYYEGLFSDVSRRSDLLWREINKLLKPNAYNNDELELTLGNKPHKGKELADKFNDYFTSLVTSHPNEEAISFLNTTNAHTAFFQPTIPEKFILRLCHSKTVRHEI